MNYYNEIDPKAAAWIRELIAAGEIPDGFVDERSITEVKPEELKNYAQCHFFAGVSGWSLALKLAGWPAARNVWTGSCPCQPFSTAGKGLGSADERHLWPAFFKLIEACRPEVVFGEQVASGAVLGPSRGKHDEATGPVWLDGVFADLEGALYTCRAFDLPAAGVNSPHIRQRVFWMAHAEVIGCGWRLAGGGGEIDSGGRPAEAGGSGFDSRLVLANSPRPLSGQPSPAPSRHRDSVEPAGSSGGVGDASGPGAWRDTGGCCEKKEELCGSRDSNGVRGYPLEPSSADGPWSQYDLIPCRDGKWRRIESSTKPLVNGVPKGVVPSGDPSVEEVQATAEARVIRLKGYGNAIVPQLAAEFVSAFMECQ